MSFDLRLPVGLMFTIFGVILIGVGLLGGPALPEQSLGINMNLWWGGVELVFGALMLFFGWRARPADEASHVPPDIPHHRNDAQDAGCRPRRAAVRLRRLVQPFGGPNRAPLLGKVDRLRGGRHTRRGGRLQR